VQRNTSHRIASYRIASQQLLEQAAHIESSRTFQTASKSSTLTYFHLFSYQSIYTTTTQRIPTRLNNEFHNDSALQFQKNKHYWHNRIHSHIEQNRPVFSRTSASASASASSLPSCIHALHYEIPRHTSDTPATILETAKKTKKGKHHYDHSQDNDNR
jgi:hypothetical protein